jgi:acetyltransferase
VFRAESIGYPLVMKVVSQDIIHKSDAGGVVLDIDNRDEAVDAYEVIMHRCKAHNPKARIEGVEIAEQVERGVEIIVGGRRDPSFGPTVMFGLGGIYVEVLKDVAFRALPLSAGEARRMIRDIRTYPLLLGVRGEPAKDMDAILDTILRVGALLDGFDDIADVEINPLMVYEQGRGGRAVDVRILLGAPDKGAGI